MITENLINPNVVAFVIFVLIVVGYGILRLLPENKAKKERHSDTLIRCPECGKRIGCKVSLFRP